MATKFASVAEALAAKSGGAIESHKPVVKATCKVENGEYVIRFPARLRESDLRLTTTGKPMITARTDSGGPVVVSTSAGTEIALDFGPINLNITLG